MKNFNTPSSVKIENTYFNPPLRIILVPFQNEIQKIGLKWI